jgi:hypothetical protein
VVLLVDPGDPERHPEALEGCRVLRRPVGRDDLLAVVAEAVDDLAHTPPPRTDRIRPVGWSRPADA